MSNKYIFYVSVQENYWFNEVCISIPFTADKTESVFKVQISVKNSVSVAKIHLVKMAIPKSAFCTKESGGKFFT